MPIKVFLFFIGININLFPNTWLLVAVAEMFDYIFIDQGFADKHPF